MVPSIDDISTLAPETELMPSLRRRAGLNLSSDLRPRAEIPATERGARERRGSNPLMTPQIECRPAATTDPFGACRVEANNADDAPHAPDMESSGGRALVR
jgi:hypothetical protein